VRMGIGDKPNAPGPPWQNDCVERLIIDPIVLIGADYRPWRFRRKRAL
jgi:hypothetical protein